MVCAFVTNQLLHDQTASSSASSDGDDATNDGSDSAADTGLVMSLVDALYAVDRYQKSTVEELRSDIVPRIRSAVNLVHSRLDGGSFPVASWDAHAHITTSSVDS